MLLAAFTSLSACLAANQPNVVLILTDDMGYSDLALYGETEIATPNIDRLAREGVTFRQAYVTAPVCVPSRMGLLTGKYQQRYGIYCNPLSEEEWSIWREQETLADWFKDAGYRTSLIGKWHLGGNKNLAFQHPEDSPWDIVPPHEAGFDEFVGISGGMSDFAEGTPLLRFEEGRYSWFDAPAYLTDVFGSEACAFIERNRQQPFFLFLSFNAPHAPLEALQSDIAPSQGVGLSDERAVYAGMVRAVDRNVGKVLDLLDSLKLADNTIVIFLNDNGGGGNNAQVHTRNTARNAPLKGYKFDVWEGGIRVPMIIRHPSKIQGGSVYEKVVSSMDVAPTVLSEAGLDDVRLRAFDGVNLVPFLGDEEREPHEYLCWQQVTYVRPNERSLLGRQKPGTLRNIYDVAIRRGDWKAVKQDQYFSTHQSPEGLKWELYNLSRDPGEQHDLATEYPSVVAELGQLFDNWQQAVMSPQVMEYRLPSSEERRP